MILLNNMYNDDKRVFDKDLIFYNILKSHCFLYPYNANLMLAFPTTIHHHCISVCVERTHGYLIRSTALHIETDTVTTVSSPAGISYRLHVSQQSLASCYLLI